MDLAARFAQADIVTKIAELVEAKILTGISDVRDESDRQGLRVVVEVSETFVRFFPRINTAGPDPLLLTRQLRVCCMVSPPSLHSIHPHNDCFSGSYFQQTLQLASVCSAIDNCPAYACLPLNHGTPCSMAGNYLGCHVLLKIVVHANPTVHLA